MTSQNPNPNMDDPTTDLFRDPDATCIMLAQNDAAAQGALLSYAVSGQQHIGNIIVVTSYAELPDPLPVVSVKWCVVGECDPHAIAVLTFNYGPNVRISEALSVSNVGKAIRTPNNPQARLPVR
jgi:hypothetical protein